MHFQNFSQKCSVLKELLTIMIGLRLNIVQDHDEI
jgi:hypothetical protein